MDTEKRIVLRRKKMHQFVLIYTLLLTNRIDERLYDSIAKVLLVE